MEREINMEGGSLESIKKDNNIVDITLIASGITMSWRTSNQLVLQQSQSLI